MFYKRENFKIYILGGVEDYLTEAAKKHKRNLMFLAFFVASLTAITLLSGELVFKSAFGFSVESQSEGINSSILLIVASFACLYEVIMLFLYKQQCDSHYFGKQLNRTDRQGSSEQLDNFKRVIELINYDMNEHTELDNLLEKHLEQSQLLIESVNKHPTPNEIQESFTSLIDTIDEVKYNTISRDAEYAGNAIFERVKYHLTESSREIDNSRLQQIKQIIDLQVMKHIPQAINGNKYTLIDSFFREHNKIVKLSEDYVLHNEDWKVYIEHQLQSNLNRYDELVALIKQQGAASRRIVFAEIYFPIFFGITSVFVSFKWIILPYLTSL
ncbi:hypothetical protein P3695_20190 [Vibrio parahaemolyticus]|nr:hypothetical protein [Vibrio parahaemolyticus]